MRTGSCLQLPLRHTYRFLGWCEGKRGVGLRSSPVSLLFVDGAVQFTESRAAVHVSDSVGAEGPDESGRIHGGSGRQAIWFIPVCWGGRGVQLGWMLRLSSPHFPSPIRHSAVFAQFNLLSFFPRRPSRKVTTPLFLALGFRSSLHVMNHARQTLQSLQQGSVFIAGGARLVLGPLITELLPQVVQGASALSGCRRRKFSLSGLCLHRFYVCWMKPVMSQLCWLVLGEVDRAGTLIPTAGFEVD